MSEYLYRVSGGEGILDERSFRSEDDLVETLAGIASNSPMFLEDLTVHVYDTEGLGRQYLGTTPAQNVAIRGEVDEDGL